MALQLLPAVVDLPPCATTPLWVRLIHRTSKSTVWAIGTALFASQMIASLMLQPGVIWWVPFALVILVNLFFSCHDVAAKIHPWRGGIFPSSAPNHTPAPARLSA